MASTNFVDGSTVFVADWFNDLNRIGYTIFGDPPAAGPLSITLNSAEQVRILGTASATNYLTFAGSNGGYPEIYVSGGYTRLTSGLCVGAENTNNVLDDASTGAGTATLYIGNAAVTVASDVRLKDKIKDTERDAMAIFGKLRVVDHIWNDPSDVCENNRNARGVWTGLIAQEADEHIPWLVNRPRTDRKEDDFMWHMDFAFMAPLFVKGFQQVEERLAALEAA